MTEEEVFRKHFNSQPHKEADTGPSPSDMFETIFQLTASQGG